MKKKQKKIISVVVILVLILLGLFLYTKEQQMEKTIIENLMREQSKSSTYNDLIQVFIKYENGDKEYFKDFKITNLKTEKDSNGNDIKAFGMIWGESTIQDYLPLGLSFLAIKDTDTNEWKIVAKTNGHEYCSDFIKNNNLEQYNFSRELLSNICDINK